MTTIRFFGALPMRHAMPALLAASLLFMTAGAAKADDFGDTLHDIQNRWAEANYRATGNAQKEAFETLLEDARNLAAANPARAEALVWQGIVASTYAGVKGPFGAMSLAKEAREVLMRAEAIDPTVLDGSVYTSLGTLYFKVPGGLIGFGDKELARVYLEKALQQNPDGIDPNYFYGEFLLEQKEYEAAKAVLLKAKHAPQRPDRPLADEGRQREVAALLEEVKRKLGHAS